MTKINGDDETIYLNGYHLGATPADKIIEVYETAEGRANSLYTLDELLFTSLGRQNVSDRIKLANYFLDKGADPSYVDSYNRANCLHVLFKRWEYDYEREAPLLQRLLDGGADINQRSRRTGYPLELVTMMLPNETDINHFYDVIFAHPGIDFGVIVNRVTGATLADLYFELPPVMAEETARAKEYIAQRGLRGDGKPPFEWVREGHSD